MKTLLLLLMPLFAAAQDTGTIMFMRNTDHAPGGKIHCFIDQKMSCLLKNNSYSRHDVPAGRHQVDVQSTGNKFKADDEPLFVNVQAGQTAYVYAIYDNSGMSIKVKINLYCLEITESSANMFLKKMKQDDCF